VVAEEEEAGREGICGETFRYRAGGSRFDSDQRWIGRKAMKRWAFNLFCLFSLLVFASSVILLVPSFLVGQSVAFIDGRSSAGTLIYTAAIARGEMSFARDIFDDGGGRGTRWVWHQERKPSSLHNLRQPNDLINIEVAGFQYNRWVTGGFSWLSRWHLVLPFWLFLPAAVPPLLWWRKRRKRRGRGFAVGVASASDPSRDREAAKTAKTAAKG
jgi:hypothetical protein